MAGKTLPAFPGHAQPAILRIWQEAHGYVAWSRWAVNEIQDRNNDVDDAAAVSAAADDGVNDNGSDIITMIMKGVMIMISVILNNNFITNNNNDKDCIDYNENIMIKLKGTLYS